MANKSRILEQSEQSIFFNIVPSPRDERDWNAEPIYDDVKRIPSTLDWRGHLQRVRNQGRQGTSLAFVGACILEWYSRKILKGELTASAQFLYNARPDKTQTLMTGRDLMEILKTHGCCTEETYVYGSKNTPAPETVEEALRFKIDGYAKIRTMETLKRALLVNGPCLVCFPVYNHTTKLWKQRKEQEKLGCHAMAVVGYNKKGFIVRNSWGEHWDTDGHCIYPYEDWGCHEEIWTVVNEQNLVKWKLRERHTIIKRMESSKIVGFFLQIVSPSEEDTDEDEDEGKEVKEQVGGKEPGNTIPVPREKIASSKETSKNVSEGTLQGLAHDDGYQEFGLKEKIVSGSNEMKKKSLVSKMFGGSSRQTPAVVVKPEEESEVFIEEPSN